MAGAIETAVVVSRTMAPSVEGHIRDGMGRNWDVSTPAPTPAHRKAIDAVRDRYDLEGLWSSPLRKQRKTVSTLSGNKLDAG